MSKKNEAFRLNTKQWELYNLIKSNSLQGKKTTQKEICEKLDYEYKERKGTTDKCSQIWLDVNEINMSSETEKLIITEKYTYWIGNEVETRNYITRYWKQILPSLTRYWKMVKKAKDNGQYKILSTRGDIIDDDSKARLYVESFIEKTLDEMTDEELMAQDLQTLRNYCESLGGYVFIREWSKKDFIKEIRECQRNRG